MANYSERKYKVQLRVNGTSGGMVPPRCEKEKEKPKRGEVRGLTTQASRRNEKFMQAMDWAMIKLIFGRGIWLTLTFKDCPTSDDFQRIRKLYLNSLQKSHHIELCHWVTEWQKRKVPHLHILVFSRYWETENTNLEPFYFDLRYIPASIREEMNAPETGGRWQGYARTMIDRWMSLAGPSGALVYGQHAKCITNEKGLALYVAEHASRGVWHYQRSQDSIPETWDKTGRMWGHSGPWPHWSTELYTDRKDFYRYRRFVARFEKNRQVTKLKKVPAYNKENQQSVRRQIKSAIISRRTFYIDDKDTGLSKEIHSRFRGVSGWIPDYCQIRYLESLGYKIPYLLDAARRVARSKE